MERKERHLSHKVTMTGSATHESKAEEKKEGEVEKASSKEKYKKHICCKRTDDAHASLRQACR